MDERLKWEATTVRHPVDKKDGDLIRTTPGGYIEIIDKVPGLPIIGLLWVSGKGRKADKIHEARERAYLIETAPSMLEYLEKLADGGDATAKELVKLATGKRYRPA